MSMPVKQCRVEGTPPPWSVTEVNKFVIGALDRVQRDGEGLPEHFLLSICPWGERNALGGTPPQVQEVIDPRLRLVHFTGCGRPYLIALFIGEDAATRQETAMRYLPWSEHFAVACRDGQAVLEYLGCTEDIWADQVPDPRTLRELLGQGALAHF
jgi:hypothetical protein